MSESTASATSLRHLMRAANHATLATIAIGHKQVEDGWPVTFWPTTGFPFCLPRRQLWQTELR